MHIAFWKAAPGYSPWHIAFWKVKPEDIKIQDKVSRKKSKKGKKIQKYPFANPIPTEMRSIQLDDICSVSIQWNMLTTLRPKNKQEEEYFSRIVELGKLRLATEEKESKFPESYFLRKMKNKAGLVETRFISCPECGEEFCETENCTMFQYDQFRRENPLEAVKQETKERGRPRNKLKKFRKTRKKTRKSSSAAADSADNPKKGKKLRKSKSHERATSSAREGESVKKTAKRRSKSAPATKTKT